MSWRLRDYPNRNTADSESPPSPLRKIENGTSCMLATQWQLRSGGVLSEVFTRTWRLVTGFGYHTHCVRGTNVRHLQLLKNVHCVEDALLNIGSENDYSSPSHSIGIR
jgi:hypothetical protein